MIEPFSNARAPILNLARRLLLASESSGRSNHPQQTPDGPPSHPSHDDDDPVSEEELALYAGLRVLMRCITLPRAREALVFTDAGLVERLAQLGSAPAWPRAGEAAAQLLKFLRSLKSSRPAGEEEGIPKLSKEERGPGADAADRVKAAAAERRAREGLQSQGQAAEPDEERPQ